MNETIARRIHELLLRASSAIDGSVAAVQDGGVAGEELSAYKQAAARVLCEIWDELLKPLYDENPALVPAELKYVPPREVPTSARNTSDRSS